MQLTEPQAGTSPAPPTPAAATGLGSPGRADGADERSKGLPRRQGLGAQLLAAALALPALGIAQADEPPERGQVSFKLLDYQDSQPGASRIRVRAPALGITAPVGAEWSIAGTLIHDAISGASPAYHTSGLTDMHDERHAVDLSATRYFARSSLTLGTSLSHESDYQSRGLSLQGTHSSEDHNTTWNAGMALTRDRIDPNNHIVEHEAKRVVDLIVGVTQVLGTHDIAQLNLGYSRGRGYFSDPYKVFDNRPPERDHRTVLARWNHHVDDAGGTLRTSYRYYQDTYGIKAHTLGFEYVQPLGRGWSVMPLLRLYTQTAARFYVDADPSTDPFPPNPPADAVYYSEDQRVSAFGARTFGLKVVKRLDADWTVDLKVEHYAQRGSWALLGTGSPQLAEFRARSVQFGVSRAF